MASLMQAPRVMNLMANFVFFGGWSRFSSGFCIFFRSDTALLWRSWGFGQGGRWNLGAGEKFVIILPVCYNCTILLWIANSC